MLALASPRAARFGVLAALLTAAVSAAGCGGAGPSSASPGDTTAAKSSQTVSVAYASSLQFLNEKVVGPAFTAAEGYKYSGYSASAGTLEAEIASGEIHPNIFESVGGGNIRPLFAKFTSWYIQYAGTSMVVAYNPRSKYAAQLKAIADGKKPVKDLFTLLETPGLKLGRTNPAIDPQARDFIYMLELAQSYYHLPPDTVTKILGGPIGSTTSPQIYAESSLDSTLQSGQLDVASAFLTQAIQLHLAYVPLPPQINLGSFSFASTYSKASVTYSAGGASVTDHGSPQVIDITIIGKPTPAAIAFVKYTLSQVGKAQYKAGGYTVLTPTVTGDASSIPAAISSEIGS